VVVLLDEIDRMEKEEILTLLKVIRGIATLPNLSFVCAGNRETIVKTVKGTFDAESSEYFEKFFPVVISVPEPDPVALRRTGTDRLVSAFMSCDWFESHIEDEEFAKRIESVWDERIAPFCKTLRAIGLLANDVSVAAALLRREVDPVDLTLIEMLHRFKPFVYSLIAKNSFALTGGESLLRGGRYHDDKDEEQARGKLLDDLKKELPDSDEFERVQGVINELFPLVSKTARQLKRAQRRSEQSTTEVADKRIREPGIFPAYFRYEVPDEIFSSVELALLLQRLELASNQAARDGIFLNTLQSMEKGSFKRDDFLRKLADAAKSLPTSTGKSLGEAAVKASDRYTYDTFTMFGEAGHVLRMIHGIAQELTKTDRVAFLQACILDATDDTMARNILTVLTHQKDDANLDVSVADLYPSFRTRMRKRFGPDVDLANIDLSTSDPWTFDLWGHINVDGVTADPKDREIQYEFWRRYIGNSRLRLAQVFRGFFLPIAVYQKDPVSIVENKIPVAVLRKLYEELPDDAALTDRDRESLSTLRRFLDGEFKNGIDPTNNLYGD
jgi:hypothetical protein